MEASQAEPKIKTESNPDMNMSSIISAIATHFKNNNKKSVESQETVAFNTVYSTAGTSQQPFVISIPQTNLTPSVNVTSSVPSAVNDIVISQDNLLTETVVTTTSDSPEAKRMRQDSNSNETTYLLDADGSVIASHVSTAPAESTTSTVTPNNPEMMSGPCPICGDRISGNCLLNS